MNLEQLLLEETQRVDERLRDLLAVGAVAGSLLQPGMVDARPRSPTAAVTQTASKAAHPSYPSALLKSHRLPTDERIEKFINVFVPLIDAQNQAILNDRAQVKKLMVLKQLSASQQRWLDTQIEKYRASDEKDLLLRMDTVPPSLVLAQAAVESGWGRDRLALKHLGFFGQRAWTTKGTARGAKGERYESFPSVGHSIAAYMQNLNSHPAYSGFRTERARLRQADKPLLGAQLAATLVKYSTRGADYTRQLQKLIADRQLAKFDRR